MPSGGDLKEITWQNDDVGSGRYFSKAGETHTLKLGGLKTDDSEDNMDSGGNFINLKSNVPWVYEAVMVVDALNPNRMELETAQALSNSFLPTTWTFTCIDGTIYTAVGSIVGDIQMDRSKSTLPFKAMGGGQAQQI
jgi:hypothetical protein